MSHLGVTSARLRWLIPPFLVGTLLRVLGMNRQSLWIDEILTLQGASIGEPFTWHDVLINPQGPLPHVLLRLWVDIFGSGDVALRSWSVSAGILALAAALLIANRLLPRGGVLAGWLFALSPFQIWYAQEVRNYVFLSLFTLLAVWTFHQARQRGGLARWSLHGLSLCGMLLSNLSGLFLLPVLGLTVLVARPRRLIPWTLTVVITLLLVSPWLRAEFGGNVAWDQVAGVEEPSRVRGDLTFHYGAIPFAMATFVGGAGLTPPLRELHHSLGFQAFLPHLPMLLLAFLASGLALLATWRERSRPEVKFLWIWALVPLVVTALVAILGLKAFNPRYAMVAQPAWIALLALGTATITAQRSGWGWAVAIALICVMLHGWGRQSLDPDYARDDFRGAARYLELHYQPGDLVLQQGVSGPLARYFNSPQAIATFFREDFGRPIGGEAHLDQLLADRPRVWWVGCRLWLEDPDDQVLTWVQNRGSEVGTWDGPGVRVRGFVLGGAP